MTIEKILEAMKNGFIDESLDLERLIYEFGSQHFVEEMLNNMGNVNSLVRENIIGVFYRLSVEEHLSLEERIGVLDTCLSESHLFNGVGSKGDDSVFWRSYSSLTVGYFVDGDVKLPESQYILALDKGIEYMSREVDRRGFVAGKGWGHAVAHGADMLCAFARNPAFPIKYADKMLDCIKFHITSRDSFVDGDETRLAEIVPILLNKGFGESAVQNWIESLLPSIKTLRYTDAHYQDMRVLFNIKYFLISLHYVLGEKSVGESLMNFISEYVPVMSKRAHS